MRRPTAAQMNDPHFQSYEKEVAIGRPLTLMQCGECDGPAVALPPITMAAPMTGTLICPRCWHPIVGRSLLTAAQHGGSMHVAKSRLADRCKPALDNLVTLGLLSRRGRTYTLTNAGLAVLWLKEAVGWEFERVHARGWYRTEKFFDGPVTGYFHNEGKTGQFIPHRTGQRHTRVWPLGGVGVLHFGKAA